MLDCNTILAILGPTSAGKSSVGIHLANKLNGEIISLDSMQIYQGMDIGTAKVTPEMTSVTRHHMIDVVEPNSSFSAFEYCQMVEPILEDLTNRGRRPIFVGGTGLYLSSLLYGLDYVTTEATLELRQKLIQLYRDEGIEAILRKLLEIDKPAYDIIDHNNIKRVIRAIEIAHAGGSITSKKIRQPLFNNRIFVLTRNRADLYKQIDARVESMMALGLIDEVQGIIDCYGHECSAFLSMKAIGYKEVIEYLAGNIDYNQCVETIKRNTRRYAKRQLTYFKQFDATWINCDDYVNHNEIAERIISILQS